MMPPVPVEDGMIGLTILSGFLGAGKSTWLQHQLHSGALNNVHVLINEAAEIPVDHLFAGHAESLTVLANGCACCEGAAELRKALRELCDRHDKQPGGTLPQLWLETSGLADPRQIMATISSDAMLARRILITGVILVVDASNLRHQLADTGLVAQQIQSATRIFLSKSDVAEQQEVAQAAATLRFLNPDAAVSLIVRGSEVSYSPDATVRPFSIFANVITKPPARAVSLHLPDDMEWSALSVWLSALLFSLGNDVLRVKGVVSTPAGRLLLQSVRDKMQTPQVLPSGTGHEGSENVLVIIGHGLDELTLRQSLMNARCW